MVPQDRLREIERATGLVYPSSFISGIDEFHVLAESEGFRRVFSDARLLLSPPDIAAVREAIPDYLLPFMGQRESSWEDIYAFDLDSNQPDCKVVVWADHAIVMDWENFGAFLQWVREHIAKHGSGDSI
jgi:hypothetical protein